MVCFNSIFKKLALFCLVVVSTLSASSAHAYLCSVNKQRTSCDSNGCVSSRFPLRYCASTRSTSIAGVFVQQRCDDSRVVKLVIKNPISDGAQESAMNLQSDLQNGVNRELGEVVSCDCEQ